MTGSDDTAPTIIFDGVCNLCEGFVRFVIGRDRRGRFRFASAQSPAGLSLQRRVGLNAMTADTLLLIDEGRAFTRSDAIIGIAKQLDGAWKLLALIRLVPRPIRDWAYVRVATSRYRLFGRKPVCMVPTPEIEARFL